MEWSSITATVVFFILCSHSSVTEAVGTCGMTPINFRSDFLTSCSSFEDNSTTCNALWAAFSGAFAFKDPVDVMRSDYEGYFNLLPIVADPNQSLFWSRVMELVGMLSCMCPTGAPIVSSANTPSSAIINNINGVGDWCGAKNTQDGIDYTSNCPCSVSTSFWEKFSMEFALAAKGTVFFLCYGETDGGAFRADSFFARFELPNLSAPRVNKLVVMNVHNMGQGETCRNGSLEMLESKVKEKGFKYSCYEVFGNPMTERDAVSECASRIITAIQQNQTPEKRDCFMESVSGTLSHLSSIMLLWIMLLLMMIII